MWELNLIYQTQNFCVWAIAFAKFYTKKLKISISKTFKIKNLTEENMAEIKKMINAILTKGNMNQKELAAKLKVSPAQITRWRDDAEPRLKNYQELEKIYNDMPA